MKKKESKELQLLREFKKERGLSYDKIGHLLGVHGMTVYAWFTGKQQPSSMARRLITELLLKGKPE